MAKTRKTRRSRFEGINLNSLNEEVAKVTKKEIKEEPKTRDVIIKKHIPSKGEMPKRGKGRPKTSKRKPLNTAIEPENKRRLEFLAMLNGGSIADQLNNILQKYFTEIERIDELIEVFEKKKEKR